MQRPPRRGADGRPWSGTGGAMYIGGGIVAVIVIILLILLLTGNLDL